MVRILEGVTEYAEGFPVELRELSIEEPGATLLREGRLVVVALNQGGFDNTAIDLLELISWMKDNRPDLLY